MDILPKNIPIFGICYGFQFLNIYFGGDLVQDLPDKAYHYKDNWFKPKKNSKFYEITKGESILGTCYHHQGLGKIKNYFLF